MKITHAEFIKSAVKPSQYPEEGLPEIAMAGRSNVGKSSLINKLLNRKKLVKVSQKPGKTQTLNYFKINQAFYFVDVPGYGYAKVSKKEKQAWADMLETYFSGSPHLKAVVQVIDFRHPPSAGDVQMYEYLKHFGLPTIIAATKSDKVKKGKFAKHKKEAFEQLDPDINDDFITFSAESGYGIDELWGAINQYTGLDAE
ncbi:ribosome biogenesis GTP-binding protein YihA/YsxC [Tuberibacillus sp. Marseille-P3662]|uniref:ribosome biogenesis GTP-binding protein YihA/YsxC n=1 Tax=Tuberibacillus sp. Marseille-P3662 TaxID=1965358 RepID=UPI000A1CA39E|nr:ribosome biogenesis GTP-binding protein YihA/YsxC [Tuberibacillus sp. Marseille-P3662]